MSPDEAAVEPSQERSIARRSVLRGLGAGALATGAGGILAACSSGSKGSPASSSTSTINIGYIAPFTGSLSGFASADKFVIDTIRNTPAYAKGFKVGGKTYQVNIIVTDSQSDPNRASQLARQLILNNNVDLLLSLVHPRDRQPGRGGGPDRGRALRGHQRPVGVLVRRPGRQPGRPEGDVPVLHPVLLRPEEPQ